MQPHIQRTVEDIDLKIGFYQRLRDALVNFGSVTQLGDTTPAAAAIAAKTPVEKTPAVSRPKRKYTRRAKSPSTPPEKRAKSERKPKAASQGEKINGAITPMSPRAIAAGSRLKEPFSAGDVAASLNGDTKLGGNTLTRWLVKGWVVRADRGQYTRTAAFGVQDSAPAAPAAPAAPKAKDEEEPAAPPDEPVEQPPADADLDPAQLTAFSAGTLKLAKHLGEKFEVADLAGHLGNNKQQAYYFIGQWKQKGWLDTISQGQYRKTKNFGIV
jgi:hypothetical protein